MLRSVMLVPIMASLLACGDPLAGVDRISDLDVPEDAESAVQALPSEEEIAREGFFNRPATTDTADNVTPQTEATKEDARPARSGFLGLFTRNTAPSPDAPTDVATDAPTDVATEPAPETDTTAAVSEALDSPPSPAPETAKPAAEKRTGLLGLLRNATPSAGKSADEPAQTASLAVDVPAAPSPQATPTETKTAGLFAKKSRPRTGPDAADVDYGDVLPYGKIARVCNARNRPMGRKIDKTPARGKGYTLFDSAPNSTGPRTFYVTGFSDNCPRQFTAALALFGAPGLHEQLRYGRPSEDFPYSETDKAYERIKSRVCKVSKRKPCGKRLEQLEKNTVFVSTYERFGGNSRWGEMLIHDGEVLASALKKAN